MMTCCYQLGGRLVFGAPIPDATSGWFAHLDRIARVDPVAAVDPVVPTWDRPRVFGHVGQNVAMPPAIVDAQPRLPARIST